TDAAGLENSTPCGCAVKEAGRQRHEQRNKSGAATQPVATTDVELQVLITYDLRTAANRRGKRTKKNYERELSRPWGSKRGGSCEPFAGRSQSGRRRPSDTPRQTATCEFLRHQSAARRGKSDRRMSF